MQKKYRKLQNTVLRSFTILAIVLISIIGFVVADRYIHGAMGSYQTTAYSYTKSAAEMIDGDKIAHYLETKEKDEHYHDIAEILNTFRENTNIRYFYVFVPYENDFVYVWDAVEDGRSSELGAVLNQTKNGAPHEILPAVKRDIDAFVGEADQFDDITMLCLEYKARMEICEEDVQ